MLIFERWKIVFVLLVTLFFTLAALPNVVPTSVRDKLPGWMSQAVPLGLDLRGGSHLVLEVDFKTYLREHLANARDGLRKELRDAKIGYTELRAGSDAISLRVRPETVGNGVNVATVIRKADPDLSIDEGEKGALRIYYDERTLKDIQSRLLQQSIAQVGHVRVRGTPRGQRL